MLSKRDILCYTKMYLIERRRHYVETFHVIATPDENGYTVTIPENPNVSARCADATDIVPTATAAREQDEQNRHEKTAVCPKCGKTYTGYPAMSRADNKTEICPECGAREALDAAGVDKAEQEKIIAEIQKAAAGI